MEHETFLAGILLTSAFSPVASTLPASPGGTQGTKGREWVPGAFSEWTGAGG